MDITFDTIYQNHDRIFRDHSINISDGTWFDPWAMGLVCLKAIELKDQADKQLLLPQDEDVLSYLKRMHLENPFRVLTYATFLQPLERVKLVERENDNICEILHCEFRDVFEARLSSKIRRMFSYFGLNEVEEPMATSLVGELGNNVFDHNDGQWPTSVRGAFILAQMNPRKKRIEVVMCDPGIGFKGSLSGVNRIIDDLEAIKLGLSGVTGRVGESRGQGLQIVQNWTINKFDGIVRIHSGSGLVAVDGSGLRSQSVFPIGGTLVSFVVKYK